MTEQVYHASPLENKCDFQIPDKIFQLNDEMDMHLEKLNALIVFANTHQKLEQCDQRVLRGYLWVMEGEMNQLSAVYEEISLYLLNQ